MLDFPQLIYQILDKMMRGNIKSQTILPANAQMFVDVMQKNIHSQLFLSSDKILDIACQMVDRNVKLFELPPFSRTDKKLFKKLLDLVYKIINKKSQKEQSIQFKVHCFNQSQQKELKSIINAQLYQKRSLFDVKQSNKDDIQKRMNNIKDEDNDQQNLLDELNESDNQQGNLGEQNSQSQQQVPKLKGRENEQTTIHLPPTRLKLESVPNQTHFLKLYQAEEQHENILLQLAQKEKQREQLGQPGQKTIKWADKETHKQYKKQINEIIKKYSKNLLKLIEYKFKVQREIMTNPQIDIHHFNQSINIPKFLDQCCKYVRTGIYNKIFQLEQRNYPNLGRKMCAKIKFITGNKDKPKQNSENKQFLKLQLYQWAKTNKFEIRAESSYNDGAHYILIYRKDNQ